MDQWAGLFQPLRLMNKGMQNMKCLAALFPLLFSVAAFFASANAQTPVKVCQGDLYFLGGRVRVKTVLVRDTLVFVDDDNPSESFSIDRTNILRMNDQSRLNDQSRIFTIHTRRPVTYRSRESMQFDFQPSGGNNVGLLSGNCVSMAAWLRNPPRIRITHRAPQRRTFLAKLRRSLSRDIEGKLEILERTIAFTPDREAERQYRWDLREINHIKRKAPFVLEITTSNDDTYTFELQNRAISPDEVYAIRDRIAKLRLGRY
jgi:hypothetical protein